MDIHKLHNIRTIDLVKIFGGYDRIKRLSQHFMCIKDKGDIQDYWINMQCIHLMH